MVNPRVSGAAPWSISTFAAPGLRANGMPTIATQPASLGNTMTRLSSKVTVGGAAPGMSMSTTPPGTAA